MTSERNNVTYPLWRKKVDTSLFRHNQTAIPKWVCEVWGFRSIFPSLQGKANKRADVSIKFSNNTYIGQIRWNWRKHRKGEQEYSLGFGDDLGNELKKVFLMTFMRDIEYRLAGYKSTSEVEKDIPFWEFLDIEFDRGTKTFLLVAHYIQKPLFPELFRELTDSPVLKRIDDKLEGKNEFQIHKQKWKPRKEYKKEIGAENVIYMLMDTKRKLFYVGEAKNLVQRFDQKHQKISGWDYYRYDRLPNSAAEYRLELERMVIRNFASILANNRGVSSMEISEYRLVNDRIDT